MNNVYLLLGSNLSGPKKQIANATKHLLKSIGIIEKQSSLYQTAAWGKRDQPDFYNQVIVMKTTLSAISVLEKIFQIENIMGRTRSEKNAPRLIDIDILFYNNDIIETKQLTVPHPAIPMRRFVLVPLNELSPLMIHPVLHRSINELLIACTDELDVKKI